MTIRRKLLSATLASLLAILVPSVGPVLAQEQVPASEVTEQDIDAFVVAYNSVAAVEQEHAEELQQAATEAEQAAVRDEVRIKAEEAINETPGMDIRKYLDILDAARNDPQLSALIVSRIQG